MTTISGLRDLKKRLLGGGIWVSAGFLVNTLAGIAVGAILTRILSTAAAGTYFLAFSLATAGAVVMQGGMNRSVVRFAARANRPEEMATARATILLSLGIVTLIVLSVFVILSLGSASRLFSTIFSNPQLAGNVPLLLLWTGFIALRGIIAESLRGLHDIRMATITERVSTNILMIAAFTVFGLIGYIGNYGSALAASVVVTAVVVALAGVRLLVKLRELPGGGRPEYKPYLKASLPLLLSQLLVMVMNQSPFWILGALSTSDELAVYGTATRAAVLTSIALLVVNNVVMSSVSSLHASGRKDDLQRLLHLSVAAAALPAIVVFVMFALFGEVVLATIFGKSYGTNELPLLLLSAGWLFNVFCGSAAVVLSMSGHEPLVLRSTFIAMLAGIASGLALIPGLGATGAAIAFGIGMMIYNTTLCLTCKARLGLTTYLTPQSLRTLLVTARRNHHHILGGSVDNTP